MSGFATFFVLLALPGDGRARTETVPFELLPTKHIVVQIHVNGKGPYRVIFDTGAPVNVLNTRTARAAGVVDKNAPSGLFDMFGAPGPSTVASLEVGGVKLANTSAVVMDHPTVELISKALGPVEGIVGFPFFARFKMTLDYQAKRMTFTPNGYQPPDAIQAMMSAVMSLADDRPALAKVLGPAAQWGLVLHKEAEDEEAGVTVREVFPGSAAATAGLRAGDRLLTLDGRWTDSVADAYRAAGYVKPGTRAVVTLQRAGREIELTVTPRAGL